MILCFATYKRNEIWKDVASPWEDALRKFPQNLRIHHWLGGAYADKGMCREAIAELGLALKEDPYYLGSHHNLAICYSQMGLLESAIKEYNLIIQLKPDYLEAYSPLAMIYINMRKIDEAYILLQNARTISASNPIINALLGHVYCEKNDYKNAFYYFSESISANPDIVYGHYAFGICLLKYGKNSESREHLIKAIEIDPEYIECYFFLAISYEQEKNHEKAIFYYREVLSHSKEESVLVKQTRMRLSELTK